MAESGCRSASLGRTTATILAWIAEHGPATALEIGRALDMDGTSMRGRLTMLARQGLLSGEPTDAKPPQRAYRVTAEGLQRAGISDAG